jgi:hypothetical protein
VHSDRGAITPKTCKGHVLIDLETPESAVSNKGLEGSYEDEPDNIGLPCTNDSEDDNYTTSQDICENSSRVGESSAIMRGDDESEIYSLEGSDDDESKDYSTSPDICDNHKVVGHTSQFGSSADICGNSKIDGETSLGLEDVITSSIASALEEVITSVSENIITCHYDGKGSHSQKYDDGYQKGHSNSEDGSRGSRIGGNNKQHKRTIKHPNLFVDIIKYWHIYVGYPEEGHVPEFEELHTLVGEYT